MQLTQPENIKVPADIKRLAEQVENPEHGFFGPDSLYWKISRERALMLGGPAAALLQMAHPGVAAGVAEHSDLMNNPVQRFERTFTVVYRIVFGNLDEAVEAASYARHMHSSVSGKITENIGEMKHGDRYHANQPNLLMWVYATLIQQSTLTYETFIAPLSDAEKEKHYQESKIFGQLFGIQPEAFPETWPEFLEYFDGVVDRALGMGKYGKVLRDQMFGGIPVYWPTIPVAYIMAGATLPKKTRKQFGLPWAWPMNHVYDAFTASVRRTLPLIPYKFRYQSYYLRARKRQKLKQAA